MAEPPGAEPAGYRIFRSLARFLAGLFYRRVEVAGLERVPLSGPLVVVADHHQGLMDGILLTAALPRRLRPVAKAPLFRYPVIGQIARLAGANPVQRRQDPGASAADSEAMFGAAQGALGQGEAILIFPEGVSQPEPALMPLRTGAARLVLGADRDLRRHLLGRRRAIMAEFQDLLRLVPEPVLDGTAR